MKRAKYAEIRDGFHHPTLSESKNHRFKLNEVEGEIISCESKSFPSGERLVMRLKGVGKNIVWANAAKMPPPAIVGQRLRGFYEEECKGSVNLLGYELLDGKKVIRRGGSSSRCEFVN